MLYSDGNAYKKEAPMSKISIIGAGAVGSSIAFAAMIRCSATELVLFDLDHNRALAEVADIGHAAFSSGSMRMSAAETLLGTANSDVVIITAGAKRKPDQTRLELLAINESIVVGMIPEILEHSPQAKIVIVSNPCDVLATRAVTKYGLSAKQVFSSGNVLDTSRLAWALSLRLGVSVESINALILGEHGDSQFPLWSQARIGNVPVLDFVGNTKPLAETELAKIGEEVKTAGATVIAGKGATNYGIGASSVLIAEAIILDQNKVLPVSSVLTDYKGVSGVAISVPTVVNSEGASKPLDVPMTDAEKASFLASAAAVSASVESLG